jgi:hypothetical protein
MDIRSSSSLRRKNSEGKILLVQSFRGLNEIITELKSNIHHNSMTTTDWIIHARVIQRWREKTTQKLIKTGRDVTVIKPTSQEHNYPRLDPPCPSVLTQLFTEI